MSDEPARTDICDWQLIDCHAHVWAAGLPMAAARHYTPGRPQSAEALLQTQHAHRVERGVLVQPSFLADANQYLAQALLRHPRHLRGVAAFQDAPAPEEIHRLHAAGVRGMRLNLFSPISLPDPDSPAWHAALEAMHAQGWHIVIAASGAALADALRVLAPLRLPLIIDHFGMPSTDDPTRCPGVRAIATANTQTECWIKLSAPYRLNQPALGILAAFDALGWKGRYIWGSDSPFTRFEHAQDYSKALAALRSLVDAGRVDPQQLCRNAEYLYFDDRRQAMNAPGRNGEAHA